MSRLAFLSGILLMLLTTVCAKADQMPRSHSVQSLLPVSISAVQPEMKVREVDPQLLAWHASGNKKPDGRETDQEKEDESVRRKAKWAKFLGIGALAGLFLPFVGLLSLPAAIVAVITGNQAKRDAPDRRTRNNAKTGLITGWITIGIFVLALALLVLLLAAFSGNWG